MALNNAAKVFADANIPLKTGLADTITQIHGFIEAGNEAGCGRPGGQGVGGPRCRAVRQPDPQGKLTVAN